MNGTGAVDEHDVAGLLGEMTAALGPVTAVVADATGPQPELTWRS